MAEQQEQPMVCIARVFKKTSKAGREYFSGRMGFTEILIFQEKKDPEAWRIMVKERPYDPADAKSPPTQDPQPGSRYAPRQLPPDLDDAIPF